MLLCETMSTLATALGLLVTSAVVAVVWLTGQNATKMTAAESEAPKQTKENVSIYLDPNGPDVQFVLFTKDFRPYNLKIGDYQGIEYSGFNKRNPTKIIIHGFLSGIREEIFLMTRDAYLSKGNYNIIGMDWSVLCEFEYFSAMKGAQLAGDALSAFLNFLVRAGVRYDDIHLIGHSLGAHVAGMGADSVKGGKVRRITGLDPAGPGYTEVPPNLRLDPGDAKLVDVIHTYMRVLSLAQPLGHVDFYPNGGRFQPGCPDFYDIWKVPESVACNHGRAYMYFAESINNNNSFRCQKCSTVDDAVYSRCFEESNVYMGNEDTYSFGLYYVKTNVKPPYSLT